VELTSQYFCNIDYASSAGGGKNEKEHLGLGIDFSGRSFDRQVHQPKQTPLEFTGHHAGRGFQYQI